MSFMGIDLDWNAVIASILAALAAYFGGKRGGSDGVGGGR